MKEFDDIYLRLLVLSLVTCPVPCVKAGWSLAVWCQGKQLSVGGQVQGAPVAKVNNNDSLETTLELLTLLRTVSEETVIVASTL